MKGQFNEEIHFQDLKQVLLTSVGLIRCLKLFAPLTVDSVPLVYMLSVEKEEKKNECEMDPPKTMNNNKNKKSNKGPEGSQEGRDIFFFTLSLASLFSLQSLALSSQLFFVYLNDFSLQCTMAKVSGGQGAKLHIL